MIRPKFHSNNFASALRIARQARRLSQEDFSLASSRTYVSSLERGLKTPTLNKVDDLAEVLDIHPLTLLTLSYVSDERDVTPESLFERVLEDLRTISINRF